MAKILKVDHAGRTVSLGMENSTVKDISIDSFNFKPEVGKEVDVFFKDDGSCIVTEVNHPDVFGAAVSSDGKHRVGKTAYILCALFLGGLGVHKFISGKTLQGILYLIFCWTCIPAIIALIEGLMACGKKPDAQGMIEV